ncbi:hypothetical protein Hanom_Chr01g00041541 [Helianthus anomalus]
MSRKSLVVTLNSACFYLFICSCFYRTSSHQAHNLVHGCGFVLRCFPSKFWVQTPILIMFIHGI